MTQRAHSHVVTLYIAFGALLVLLVATIAVSRIDLGPWSAPLALAIAGCKALVIVAYFMHVVHSPPLIRVVIGAGLLTLAIMFTLGLSDYWTRSWLPAPSPIPSSSKSVSESLSVQSPTPSKGGH